MLLKTEHGEIINTEAIKVYKLEGTVLIIKEDRIFTKYTLTKESARLLSMKLEKEVK